MQKNLKSLPDFTFVEIENIISGPEQTPGNRRMAQTYKKVKDILIEKERKASEAPSLEDMASDYASKNGIQYQQQRYHSAVRGRSQNLSTSTPQQAKVSYGIYPPVMKDIKTLGLSKKSTIVETTKARLLSENSPKPQLPKKNLQITPEVHEINSDTQTTE